MSGPLFSARRIPIGSHPSGPYVCPKCGAEYPVPGTCHGQGEDKHPETAVRK